LQLKTTNDWFCVGFSDTAGTVLAAMISALTGVGEAPMQEIAELFALMVQQFRPMVI
jgi:hypothetical protein